MSGPCVRAGDGKNTIIGRLAVATQHVSGIAILQYESNGRDLLSTKMMCASSANYNTYCFVMKTIALHLAFRSTRGAENACMLGAAPAGYCFDVEASQTINTPSVPTQNSRYWRFALGVIDLATNFSEMVQRSRYHSCALTAQHMYAKSCNPFWER